MLDIKRVRKVKRNESSRASERVIAHIKWAGKKKPGKRETKSNESIECVYGWSYIACMKMMKR